WRGVHPVAAIGRRGAPLLDSVGEQDRVGLSTGAVVSLGVDRRNLPLGRAEAGRRRRVGRVVVGLRRPIHLTPGGVERVGQQAPTTGGLALGLAFAQQAVV